MKKAIFIAILIIVIGVASYFLFFMMTKNKAIKLIVAAAPSTRTAASLSGFDDTYLIEWGKALRGKDSDFTTGGKTYDSLTGRAK